MGYKSNRSLASKILDTFYCDKKQFTGETLFKTNTANTTANNSAPYRTVNSISAESPNKIYENNVIHFPQQNAKPSYNPSVNPNHSLDALLKQMSDKQFKVNPLALKLIKTIAALNPESRRKYFISGFVGLYVLHSAFPKFTVGALPFVIFGVVYFLLQKPSK